MRKARKARAIHLSADMTVAAAMQCVVAECLRHLQDNMPGIVEDGDSECVHQARVALRRLRSANNAFHHVCTSKKWQTILQEAQWLASVLGNARDVQILMAHTLPSIAHKQAAQVDFAPLYACLSQRAERALKKSRTALRSRRCRALMVQLKEWLEIKPGRQRMELTKFSHRALTRRWRRVEKLAKRWDKLDEVQRHQLRKSAKKLRYSIEFFASLFDANRVEKYLRQLEKIQTVLGDLNDIATAQTLIRSLRPRIESAPAANAVLEWLRCAEESQRNTAAIALNKWKNSALFWH